MISIQQALEEVIADSPFLEDGMYHWYINFSSFASYIQPRIERITKKKVTVSSIKMWLTKYSQDKQKSITYKKFSIEDFYIKKHIKIIYMDKNLTTLEYIKNIHSEELPKENYLAIISGWREIWVIYDEKLSHIIEENIDLQSRKVELTGLSVIGIYMHDGAAVIWQVWSKFKIMIWSVWKWKSVLPVLHYINLLNGLFNKYILNYSFHISS